MPNYIRIINRPYWPEEEEINNGVDIKSIEARTITQDLKTKDNTLSLWYVDNDEDAVLAMVSGASKLEDIYTLKLKDELLENSELQIENEEGKTIVNDINKYHYNIKNVTYKNLGDVSSIIIESLKDENNLKTYIIDDVKKILRQAINDKRIKEKSLNPNIRKALQQEV